MSTDIEEELAIEDISLKIVLQLSKRNEDGKYSFDVNFDNVTSAELAFTIMRMVSTAFEDKDVALEFMDVLDIYKDDFYREEVDGNGKGD